MIFGYKCFNKGLTNRYGYKFEVGKEYIRTGEIKFGNNGNGFHFCKNIEDTFRYFNAMEEEIEVCLVIGDGACEKYEDTYNEYYDLYSVEKLKIVKVLTREEIINIGINLDEIRVKRFIQGFKLNSQEIELFKDKFQNNISVINVILYYQDKDKEVYKRLLK